MTLIESSLKDLIDYYLHTIGEQLKIFLLLYDEALVLFTLSLKKHDKSW